MAFKIVLTGFVALLSGLMPAVAEAQAVYYTPRAVLAEFFPRSASVTYRRFELSGEVRARVEREIGEPMRKAAYTIYVAQSGKDHEVIDGYAVLDEEPGEHQPITFAVKFSPTGAVLRQEIMVYRERYGEEVRDERFRRQFVGKTARDGLRPGLDIVAVSGATISSRAMAVGVRRALVLLTELVLASRGPAPAMQAQRQQSDRSGQRAL